MGITSFLPGTPAPNILAIVAAVSLVVITISRLFGWKSAEATKKDYQLTLLIITTVLATGFAGVAYSGIMESLSSGNMIVMFGGPTLVVLIVMVALRLVIGAGSFWRGRLPLALIALLALTMVVATIGYAQAVFSNSGGFQDNTMWWNMYKVVLVVADALSIFIVLYLGVLLVIWLIMVPIKAYRHRRAASAPTAGTP